MAFSHANPAAWPISEYERCGVTGRLTRLVASGDIAIGLFRIALGLVKIFGIGMLLERGAALCGMPGMPVCCQLGATVLMACSLCQLLRLF